MNLVGKTVVKLYANEDKTALKFVTDGNEEIIAWCEAECCSETFIQHIEFSQIFPAQVISVEDVQMESLPETEYGDLTQCYGCKILTDKGVFFFEYRNVSNGYYGGSIKWDEEKYSWPEKYQQIKTSQKWVEINADF